MTLVNAFRYNLQRIIDGRNINRAELAVMLNRTPSRVSQLFHSNSAISIRIVEEIAAKLGCSPFELLRNPEETSTRLRSRAKK